MDREQQKQRLIIINRNVSAIGILHVQWSDPQSDAAMSLIPTCRSSAHDIYTVYPLYCVESVKSTFFYEIAVKCLLLLLKPKSISSTKQRLIVVCGSLVNRVAKSAETRLLTFFVQRILLSAISELSMDQKYLRPVSRCNLAQ